ncbi:MAG TPA: bifunctional homocysteine S-methyltransferase/methylenetetrahydrofolate reductase [Ktedonobacter sp.]|jgi:homocysteine S-methyltransferase|nr:bifunctional homocysteine S-methyltransferase/methylenetetrahydrofolate reductase [Ktedonobacter sp.]HAH00246.1 bifunctional homocysteine S-methyltransferase/methylenetetrahydrofolate reductase [Ktedonobacter sp.]HAT43799.1 bifunctional homocysteine S-methyltransferase/methylenetetrahydrofolate reductase [Ktedonobacter sp.]HBE24461.1 bifunctional homocysteine S-methyltransferase/methylenetetrahydrofolate reductase [Ktedonobacter sp.]HBE29168.1 bifunctional homocysteine S-methyltransferase/me
MEHTFLEQLRKRPLLCDGAMGSLLYARGITYEQCFDELNLIQPELIESIHSEYISAGAQIIETNTFGANHAKLETYNLEERVREINIRAVKLAREAREISGQPVFIAGAVGPSGRPLQAPDEQRLSELRTIFREQIDALLVGGVDLLMLETFSSLAELRQAVLAAQDVGGLPIVAQMSFYEDGHTLSGQSAARVAAVLNDMGVDVMGANCSVGPAATLDVLQEMIAADEQFGDNKRAVPQMFSAQPNAGLPTRIGNRFFYMATPDYFADYTVRFARAGVQLIGGCCGTTPRHIGAMRKALDGVYGAATSFIPNTSRESQQAKPIEITNGKATIAGLIEEEVILPQQGTKTRLQEKLEAREFVVSVELDPPKGLNPAKILEGAALLQKVGVDFFNIADSPMARVRMGCIAMARLIQDHLGIETIIHFTTRDRNLMALQSELLGAHALGIRNILSLTGDPLRVGDYPNTTGVWDVDSIGLIRVLRGMNEGHDAAGSSIGAQASFHIGAALNLNMTDEETDQEIEKYRRKIEAGAHFIMTQPIYELAPLERFLERAGKPPIPILLGCIPLHSSRHAEYLHNEVPGITIPDDVRSRMRAAGEQGHEEGLKLAQELLMSARSMIQGVYLMPSYGRYDVVSKLTKMLLMQQIV